MTLSHDVSTINTLFCLLLLLLLLLYHQNNLLSPKADAHFPFPQRVEG